MEHGKYSEQDKAFYSDGYKLGSLAVESGLKDSDILQAVSKLYSEVDGLIDSLLNYAKAQKINVDCQKGCSWCCHQPIFALSHEIHYLTNFIANNFDKDQINQILEKAKAKNDVVEKLSSSEMLNYKSPCPLLIDGACSAYEARPMACRIYLSMSVTTCRKFYTEPEKEDSIVNLLAFPLQAGRMMNEGFKAALKTGSRETAEFRIEHGLLLGLK